MTLTRSAHAVLLALLSAGLACGGDTSGPGGDGNGGGGGGGTPGNTLSGSVQPIFSAQCALSGCHAGTAPAEGLNLSVGQTISNTVDVPSNQSSLLRINPGQPDLSYLVHKIQGTQASVGGTGSQMPLTGCCLSQAQINTIRNWITAGAQNN